MNLKGQWVWITGASSGLGLALAKQLASRGANLIVSARRLERLEALAKELSTAHGIEARALAGDMSKSSDVERLISEVKKTPVAAVVLNAGITHLGHHHELEWAAFETMLQTNVVGTTRITSELVRHYKTTGGSLRVMLVTSMAGLIPVPFQSAYSGTKAFLTAFGTALAHELKGSPISVTVFAPGGIATEMTAGDKFGSLRGWLAPVESVAAEAVAALESRPPLWVQGFSNRMGLFLARLVPRNLFLGQLARTYRKALADASARAAGGDAASKPSAKTP
ncbi:MAG: SDR family NAD(P)-dependent oxidoreductase [Archangium sp.]|nr:SDR family NAD(P)-dependent oxidoreductase [Archangium sp.]